MAVATTPQTFDWNALLKTINTGLDFGSSLLKNPAVQTLTGAGLLAASTNQKDPGYVTESQQYLRNRLSPTGIADQFSGQIAALNQEYQPLIEQQRNQVLNNTQQRYIAGQPSSFSTAMSGPEIQRIRDAEVNTILPAERAHYADIGRSMLTMGGDAAAGLLNYGATQKNALSDALGGLGGQLLSQGLGLGTGGATAPMTTGGSALQLLGQLATQPGGIGQALSQNPQLVAQLGTALGAQLGFDASMAGGGLSGWTAMTSNGVAIPVEAINAGGAGAAGGMAGVASALGLAGAGALGYGAGQLVSQVGQNQFQSSAGGAAAGAAAGAALGSVIPGVGTAIGAVVGGIAGLFGGFGGERSQQAQEKAAFRQSDVDSQRDQAFELGNIGVQWAQRFGIDSTAFQQQVQQLAGTIESPADEQTMIAQSIGAMLRSRLSAQEIQTLAPQLRDEFIDWLTRNTFSSGNSSMAGGPPTNLFPVWAGSVGLN